MLKILYRNARDFFLDFLPDKTILFVALSDLDTIMKFFTYGMLGVVSLFFFSFASAYQEILIEERGGKPIRVIKVILDGEHFVVSALAKNGGETLEELTKKVA